MILKGVTTGTGIVKGDNKNSVHVTGKFVCTLSRSPARPFNNADQQKPLYRWRYTERLARV
jgi:hypothetical protein